ncbi:hypothetical protein PENTCL1PPCAC_5931 [Pristionchus entomophagus]|uniref:G protein-coupled receptor n=1 Tax=Pristionchus entomophagus TaxID=358040 RepID=A0AAV5SK95_9BILA|nr:hypothetical protein PENTCL1PPCAC_5931 [Pristionchus entomophagus]
MPRYLVYLNHSQTHEFFPLFEIVFGIELRIAFILATIHGTIGSLSRLFLLYVEATADYLQEYETELRIATMIRSIFFTYFATG